MSWDWGAVNQVVDDVIITAGIVVLVVRQFGWRSTQPHRMLRLPLMIIAAGLVYLVIEMRNGFGWVAADWILVGELLLVGVTGTIMGSVTRFRTRNGLLEYKLRPAGVWLWILFVAVRLGTFLLATKLGANLAGATGLILLSFGVNRLAAISVVRRRTESILDDESIRGSRALSG